MLCTNCKHRVELDGKTVCVKNNTVIYAVADFDLGTRLSNCRYEPKTSGEEITASVKKTAKKAVAKADKKE